MPFNFGRLSFTSSNGSNKPNASLDDVLRDTNQKIDFILLVTLCTDHMRDCMTAAFENHRVEKSSATTADQVLWEHDEHEKEADSPKSRLDLKWARNRDFGGSRMQELKTEGTDFFDKWQSAVLARMGEAMKVLPEHVEAAKQRHKDSQHENAQLQMNKDYYSLAEGSQLPVKPVEKPSTATLPFPKPIIPDTLQKLNEKDRALLLSALLFMLLSLENYLAHSRVLMTYVCQSLDLPYDVLGTVEITTAATLLDVASKSDADMDGEDARKKQADDGAAGRKWKVGLATVAGAAVIGITGGLAAPLIIGVAGTIMSGIGLGGLATLLGATIANPLTIGTLFGALGARMTGRAMDAYSKEVQDFRFLPIDQTVKPTTLLQPDDPTPTHKLRVAIGVSGWVTKESDVSLPWRVFSSNTLEPFALRYEQAALIELGTTLNSVLKDTAYSLVQSKAIQLVLPAIAAAMAPMGLLKAGSFIDNPFTIAMERSDKAGKVLARALMDKVQGERPVTLVGFSLGSRVIYSCLEELAAQKAYGLVENAIFIGSPIPSSEMSWRRMRAIVVGRVVNVYTQRDMILGFLYRARNIQLGVAGLQRITSVPGVENKDVSNIVTGHNQYRLAVGRILKELEFADLDIDQVDQEDIELEHEKIYEEDIYNEAKNEGRLDGIEDESGQIVMREEYEHVHSNQATRKFSVVHSDSAFSKRLNSLHSALSNHRQKELTQPVRPRFFSNAVQYPPHQISEEIETSESDAESDHGPFEMIELEHEPISVSH